MFTWTEEQWMAHFAVLVAVTALYLLHKIAEIPRMGASIWSR
jgi:hypothetical protein